MKKRFIIYLLPLVMMGIFACTQLYACMDNDKDKNTENKKKVEQTKQNKGIEKKQVTIATPVIKKKGESKSIIYVYIAEGGKKYHKKDCSFLKKSRIKIKLSEAKRRGYTGCSRCKAPK